MHTVYCTVKGRVKKRNFVVVFLDVGVPRYWCTICELVFSCTALWYFWNNILVSWSRVLLLCWFNGSDVQVCWRSGLLVNWGTDILVYLGTYVLYVPPYRHTNVGTTVHSTDVPISVHRELAYCSKGYLCT
jgi:hypothetical protein